MDIHVGDPVKIGFKVHNFDGELTDADFLPVGSLRVDGDADATVVTVTNIGTGEYEASYTVPSWDTGSYVSLTIAVIVDGVVDKAVQNAVVRSVLPLSEDDIEAIADAVIAASAASDLNIEPVPTSRVFLMVPQQDDEELVSESTKRIKAGSPGRTYAIDFRADAAANQKIYSVNALTIETGTSGGVTFGTPGREGTQVKVAITGVTAGEYEVLVSGLYGSASGPPFRGIILIEIVD